MRILNHEDVAIALRSGAFSPVRAVQDAYITHCLGQTALPFSCFLRPLGHRGDRIIALPAHLHGQQDVMGVKWISSFPGNTERGLQRASSVMVLNDPGTGYPLAVLEASQISSTRTAASAALASQTLHGMKPVLTVGFIGSGTINRRVLDFLVLLHSDLRVIRVQDAALERATRFARSALAAYPFLDVEVQQSAQDVLRGADTVSIATTDSTYWLDLDNDSSGEDQVILHLSLRDLSTASILAATNVVDDIEHVCRAGTSIERAAEESGGRTFITATLGELLSDVRELPRNGKPIIFSPFGLGILDLAVARQVLDFADVHDLGSDISGFDPGRQQFSGSRRSGE
ncbi:MAG: 2,3-diaminopropionate biosynthesis protein SbnB [Propionibacterium acidifaciens]